MVLGFQTRGEGGKRGLGGRYRKRDSELKITRPEIPPERKNDNLFSIRKK